jgi:hypothetical protein
MLANRTLRSLLVFSFFCAMSGFTTVSGARTVITDQLLYTIGHLNGNRSVGRLDRLVLSNITVTAQAGGKYAVAYDAEMPVA